MSSKKLLFDQFLLVSLKEDINGAGGIIPFVKDVYPPDQVDPNVPLFCFPEEIDKSFTSASYTPSKSSESFSFVLTDREGNQQFGFTRRIVTGRMPESLCIISHHAWFSTFTAMLEILEARYRVSVGEIHNFLAAALLSAIPAPGDTFTVYIYNNPFLSTTASTRDRSNSTPNPGTSVDSTGGGNKSTLSNSQQQQPLPVSYQLRRPLSTDKSSLHDGTLLPLIESLTSQRIISLFISLLFERRIIIYSENISRVSKFVNAAVSMIDPFVWQHIFIPILPRSLLDYVTAPMPFIIGIHSSLFPLVRRKPLSEIIFVNLDKDELLPLPEDIALFPPPLMLSLKVSLDQQILDWKKNKHYDNKIIVETFRKFFVTILGTYRRFFMKDLDKKKTIFDKPSFIDSQLITPTKFFTVFCSSQMFERFIAEREEYYYKGITPPGIFEKDVILYDLKHPVTASINNTLKSKEKEKEKERERERLEKERAKSLVKANAYKTVLVDPKKQAIMNPPKSNGSVDKNFFSSLIGGVTNSNPNPSGLTVQQPSSMTVRAPSPTMSRSTTMGNISSKSHTVTSIDSSMKDSLSNVTLPIPPHILQQQQQQQMNQNNNSSLSSSTSGAGGASLPKPKSHTNLASLASSFVQNAASITKSTSTSFTLGGGGGHSSHQLLPPQPNLVPPTSSSLSVSNTSGHGHSRTFSDVGQMLLSSVTKKSTQILSSSPIPPSRHPHPSPQSNNNNNNNNSISTGGLGVSVSSTTSAAAATVSVMSTPTTQPIDFEQTIQQHHPNSLARKSIGFRSLPFALIHQKFSPTDPTKMMIEDIFNLFYPGQKPSSSSSSTTTTNTTTNQDKKDNLFKIPEHFAIPTSITKKTTPSSSSSSNHHNNNNSTGLTTSTTGIQVNGVPASFSVSDKSTLPPPPVSPHSLLHRRTHQRSCSVSTSTPSSRQLTNSLDPTVVTNQLAPTSILPPPPPSSHIPLNNSFNNTYKDINNKDKDINKDNNNQNNNHNIPQNNNNNELPPINSLKLSSSLPKPVVNQFIAEPQQPVQVVQQVQQQPIQQQQPIAPVIPADHNPLPPLTTSVDLQQQQGGVLDSSSTSSLTTNCSTNSLPLQQQVQQQSTIPISIPMTTGVVGGGMGRLPPQPLSKTPSYSNFFDNNPLSTNIEPTSVLPISASSNNNFFNECSSLGTYSAIPQIAQSGSDFYSPFVSSTSSFGSFTGAPLQHQQIANIMNSSGGGMMMINNTSAPSSMNINAIHSQNGCGNGMGIMNSGMNSSASSVSSTTSTMSSVLPPLISASGMIPPPSLSSHHHFFNNSPLNQSSSFVDFGPPLPSRPATNTNNTNVQSTPPPSIINNNNINNPLPNFEQVVSIQSIQPPPQMMVVVNNNNNNNNNDEPNNVDEFENFVAMKNQQKQQQQLQQQQQT